MQMKLKKKYTTLNEPRSWYNLAGKKNVTQWGSGGGHNDKRKFPKGSPHAVGLSGRSLSIKKKY